MVLTPSSSRKSCSLPVRSASYGVSTASLRRFSRRSTSASAPDVVTAAGAPASRMTAHRSRSAGTPLTKLPELHR